MAKGGVNSPAPARLVGIFHDAISELHIVDPAAAKAIRTRYPRAGLISAWESNSSAIEAIQRELAARRGVVAPSAGESTQVLPGEPFVDTPFAVAQVIEQPDLPVSKKGSDLPDDLSVTVTDISTPLLLMAPSSEPIPATRALTIIEESPAAAAPTPADTPPCVEPVSTSLIKLLPSRALSLIDPYYPAAWDKANQERDQAIKWLKLCAPAGVFDIPDVQPHVPAWQPAPAFQWQYKDWRKARMFS